METPTFKSKKELFKWLIENKSDIMALKKKTFKTTDDFKCPIFINENPMTEKAVADVPKNATEIMVNVVLNTTNYMDSHLDVHLPGMWRKTLKENKNLYHLESHKQEFDKIIARPEDVKASTKIMTWAELDHPEFKGTTEALMFGSNVKLKRNPKMFNAYLDGEVDQHSVLMGYEKFELAVNDPDYPDEYKEWVKHYGSIVNKEMPDKYGYFYPVYEARLTEGSAVLFGSNDITPTYNIEPVKATDIVKCPNCGQKYHYNSINESGMGYINCPNCQTPITQSMKFEPVKATHEEPPQGTPFDVMQAIQKRKILI